MRPGLTTAAAIASGLFLLVAACQSSNPVAPPAPGGSGGSGGSGGTGSFTVVVTANPSQIEVGASDRLTVTVTATRTDDGQPAADGTEAVVNTDLGGLATGGGTPASLVTVQLTGGRAEVEFVPGDVLGTATVLAQVGSSIGTLEIDVVEEVPEAFFISSVVPSVGVPEGGDAVTILGDGFVEPLLVSFANAQATVVAVASPQEIVVETPPAVVPVQPGTTLLVDVSVTRDLSSATPLRATLTGAFTYATETLPTVFLTGLDPASSGASGGTVVTLSGGGFREPLRVDFGTAVASVTSVTDSRIVVVAPPPPTPVGAGQSLAVDVTLHNALDVGTQAPVSLPAGFTYQGDPLPDTITVTSAQPTEGAYTGGTLVVVSGSGFAEPVAVDLGGVRQRDERVVDGSVQFSTAGVVVTSCPAGGRLPQQGLTVTNLATGAQGMLATFVFDYVVPVPLLVSVAPNTGGQGGHDLVQVSGSGFEFPVRVLFTVGGETFVGSDPTATSTLVQVRTPEVPNTVFIQVACTTNDDPPVQGVQYAPTPADVEVVNLLTGCADTLPNAYTYRPGDTTCRTP